MYHVTNSVLDESSVHPDWTEIRPSAAKNETYDGELVGLPIASFSTTRYQDHLPSITVYPRDGDQGKLYWRVQVPFVSNECTT